MKITIENGANFNVITIMRRTSEQGEYYIMMCEGTAYHDTFPMPKGDGFLELNV